MPITDSDRKVIEDLVALYAELHRQWHEMADVIVGYATTEGADFRAADRAATWQWILQHLGIRPVAPDEPPKEP